jgi:hypothetical protein
MRKLLIAALMLAGCRKPEPPPAFVLTEDHLIRFADSLCAPHPILDPPAEPKVYETVACRFGFRDGVEYLEVWNRIRLARTIVQAEEAKARAVETLRQEIRSLEEHLQNPQVKDDMRRILKSQIETEQRQLDELRVPEKCSLSAAELDLIKRYLPTIRP